MVDKMPKDTLASEYLLDWKYYKNPMLLLLKVLVYNELPNKNIDPLFVHNLFK
jgi:hypothetical protein